ncbi:MAG: DUF4403 family protein [Bryobacteraceae bacterium]|nr:DUF4403 family protein [Bryobacteraceae bacterium]
MRIPLDGFVREAEGWIPVRHQSEWQPLEKSAFGQSLKAPLATRFSLRRSPIEWQTLGDRIEMRLPVVYRVELGVPVIERGLRIGWRQVSYCEPKPGAVLRVETRLELQPNWAIEAHSRPVLDLAAPCRLRNLNLDITPQVRRVFTTSLERAARELDAQIAQRADLRRLAANLWARLHEPVAIGPKLWLELHPRGVSLDRPRLEHGEVRTGLRLLGDPRVSGVATPSPAGPLPALSLTGDAGPASFDLDLDVDLTWPEFNARLQESMVGKVFQTAGNRRLRLTAISAAPNGERLVLEASVDGSFKGQLAMSGRPVVRDGVLSFEELRYSLETDSMLIRLANWLRQDLYRRQFTKSARVDLVEFLGSQRQRLEEALRAGWTGGELRLEGKLERVESGAFELTGESLRIRARVTGEVSVVVMR